MGYLIPNYDRWLDEPYQRDMDARDEAEEQRTWLDEDDDDTPTLDMDEVRADLGLDEDDGMGDY